MEVLEILEKMRSLGMGKNEDDTVSSCPRIILRSVDDIINNYNNDDQIQYYNASTQNRSDQVSDESTRTCCGAVVSPIRPSDSNCPLLLPRIDPNDGLTRYLLAIPCETAQLIISRRRFLPLWAPMMPRRIYLGISELRAA